MPRQKTIWDVKSRVLFSEPSIARSRDTSLTPHITVYFVMSSDHFDHAFQSTTFTVHEFRQGSEKLDMYLQSLADKLNSNQEFTPDNTFTMEMTFIHTPAPGSGNGKNYKPGRQALNKLLERKRTVVQISNEDELCCARAIVTMQAWFHKDDDINGIRNYDNLRQGHPIQTRLAGALHMQAGVQMGPCGFLVNIIYLSQFYFLPLIFTQNIVFLAFFNRNSNNFKQICQSTSLKWCLWMHPIASSLRDHRPNM